MDLYWGGPERHITGLTVKIIGVNAAALLILLVGIIYLGQYQLRLIEAKLETFGAQVELISAAIAEGSIESIKQPTISPFDKNNTKNSLSEIQARKMVRRLSATTNQHIKLFNNNGNLIVDSHQLIDPDGSIYISSLEPVKDTLYSVEILKSLAGMVLKMLPERRSLPLYQEENSTSVNDYPDAIKALRGDSSISAWNSKEEYIILSASSPLIKNGKTYGAILLTREARDIQKDIADVWLKVLQAFALTLVVTILLSIYLSGTIARPLRKLAKASENVRKGKSKGNEIPDFSHRHDEIGELSLVLRDMTQALWSRMDSIESFAADVSHELKNPLTSLRSAVETVSIVKKDKDRKQLMDIIKHDVDRMDRLISDISHASRLDSELSREQMTLVDLRLILHNIINAYKDPLLRKDAQDILGWPNRAENQGIAINLKAQTNRDILVWGSQSRLTQVIENILSNALTFSPENGEILITVTPLHNRVSITIEDNGPGIPDNKLETIFERFYSERPQEEDYGKHSGLGLSICKQIITAMNGQIFADNRKGYDGETIGARFTVILNMANEL